MHGIVTDHIRDLTELLAELCRVGARTRFHIALAHLHTHVERVSRAATAYLG